MIILDFGRFNYPGRQDLYQVLANREMFDMLLERGYDYILSDKERHLMIHLDWLCRNHVLNTVRAF